MEQMQYNLLFRWFVGLGIDDPVWVPTVFTKNRDRLLTTEMSRKVMAAILAQRLDHLEHHRIPQGGIRDLEIPFGHDALGGLARDGGRRCRRSRPF